MQNILNLQPRAVIGFFSEISAIPRGSGNEKAVADYLESFAHKRGLSFYRDELENVMIRKSAQGCRADAPCIALQGHTDMVCEKDMVTTHDFSNDPIELIAEDGFLHANATTLGADDGIAVAIMLALLDDKGLRHPPLECIFTSQEEIGLLGAGAFDGSQITAKGMINIDSEEEGVATVSCCGGARMHLAKPLTYERTAKNAFEITVTGLAGGHSGMDIGKGRVSALKLLGQVLTALGKDLPFSLISIDGGGKDNAIARESRGVIAADTTLARVTELVDVIHQALARTLTPDDQGFSVAIAPAAADTVLTKACAADILTFINVSPHGVLTRFAHSHEHVESSINFASMTTDAGELSCVFSARSADDEQRGSIVKQLREAASPLGFSMAVSGDYPGWAYAEKSWMRDLFAESYRELFGKELRFDVIHAGLECGLFKAKCPELDIIAIGATIIDCHTPRERMSLVSCERIWELLVDVLGRLCA